MQVTAPGWASLVCLMVGLFGLTLSMLGLIGDYIARIYEELKARPLYIVQSFTNIPSPRESGMRQANPVRWPLTAEDDYHENTLSSLVNGEVKK